MSGEARQFGTELRRLRLEAERSLKDIADLLGTSVVYISDVERGRRYPFKVAQIREITDYLCRQDKFGELAELALKDRGSIQLAPHTQKQRQLLVALQRRLDTGTLSDTTILGIEGILDESNSGDSQ